MCFVNVHSHMLLRTFTNHYISASHLLVYDFFYYHFHQIIHIVYYLLNHKIDADYNQRAEHY